MSYLRTISKALIAVDTFQDGGLGPLARTESVDNFVKKQAFRCRQVALALTCDASMTNEAATN